MSQQNLPEWCKAEDWCPVTVTAELMGRKWHPVIIHRLLQKPMGFNELQRQVHKISDKVLSESLTDLQNKNIVKKQITNENPKEVEYSLTDKGKTLKPVLKSMKEWGQQNADTL